jgi:hypothetical protein
LLDEKGLRVGKQLIRGGKMVNGETSLRMHRKSGGGLDLFSDVLVFGPAIVASRVICWNSSDIKEYTGPNEAIQTDYVLHYTVIGRGTGLP